MGCLDMNIKLPLGMDIFSEIRKEHYYYIDKTEFIRELLTKAFQVNLITRPRRFGKTLTMSMMEDFFDISRDSSAHFEGLKIAQETELCSEWRNKWPVIFLTLKSVEGNDFGTAYAQLAALISDFCIAHSFLAESQKVNPFDRDLAGRLMKKTATDEEVRNSLYTLTRMMSAHYGKPVILLLDEYDVPLAKASENGYYQEMLDVIRALLGKVLKTNEFLKFAVITGCLKMAKESIFTGTNNFVSDTIADDRFNEYIGFTQENIDKLLEDTKLSEHVDEMKFWYDGYHFGKVEVYCPWDVLNHVNVLQRNPYARPQSYWENTSHNGIIRQFIDRTDLWREEHINEDIETLLAGGSIQKRITPNLTYDVLHSSAENLWSLMFLTGYLTQIPADEDDVSGAALSTGGQPVNLRIPNEEIRHLFHTTVKEWFKDKVKASKRSDLFYALWNQDEKACAEMLSDMVFDTISFYDYKEDFCHAFMTGILSFAGYKVISNREQGEGRSDITLLDERNARAIVIEVKHTKKFKEMDKMCEEALEQIRTARYAEALEEEYEEILCYGICFFKKRCAVKAEKYR